MFKKFFFFVALILVIFSVNTSYAWRPTGGRNYGNFEKLDQKAYTYDVAWYENTNGAEASWINSDGSTRFPISVVDLDGSTKTYNTKTDFINDIIVPAMNEFNNKIPGYSFTYSGYTYGTSSSPYSVNDGKSVIQIYRQNSGDGGGAAWWGLGYDEFGYKMYVGNTGSNKKWNIFVCRHEFIHCLFFSHKTEDLFGPTNSGNFYSFSYHRLGCNLTDGVGNNIFRELNEDTIAGIDEVYNTNNWDLTLQGTVADEYSTGYAEAYLFDDNTKK